jgi:hypothetical protein
MSDTTFNATPRKLIGSSGKSENSTTCKQRVESENAAVFRAL